MYCVDARTVGLGSTSASTAMLQYELDTPLPKLPDQIGWTAVQRSYQMCSDSIDTIVNISKELNFPLFEKLKSQPKPIKCNCIILYAEHSKMRFCKEIKNHFKYKYVNFTNFTKIV